MWNSYSYLSDDPFTYYHQQECIPVGCVSTAALTATGLWVWGWMCASGVHPATQLHAGIHPTPNCMLGYTPPSRQNNWQTLMKTLPSLAVCNKRLQTLASKDTNWSSTILLHPTLDDRISRNPMKKVLFHCKIAVLTSMHSSRMRTARLLTVSGDLGGLPLEGDSALRGRSACPMWLWEGKHPLPPLWTDRRPWKHYLPATSFASGKNKQGTAAS